MIVPDNTKQALSAGGVKSRRSEQASREKQPVRAAAAVGRVLSGAVRAGCRGTKVYARTTERAKARDYANMGAASRCWFFKTSRCWFFKILIEKKKKLEYNKYICASYLAGGQTRVR